MKKRKNRIKYLLLACVTAVIIGSCFFLPSVFFQFMDAQWIEKRIQQVSNTGNGLAINSLSLVDKLTILQNGVNGEETFNKNLIFNSKKRKKSEVIQTAEQEIVKLSGPVNELLQDGQISLTDCCYACDAELVTDERSVNAFFVWELGFAFEAEDLYISTNAIVDDASGKLLALYMGGLPEGWLDVYMKEMMMNAGIDELQEENEEEYAMSQAVYLGNVYAEYLNYSVQEIIYDDGEYVILQIGNQEERCEMTFVVGNNELMINPF